MTAPALFTTRRAPAGLTPPPGFLARLPVWWSATHWCEFDVRGALTLHRDVCATHHVAPDTVLAVARAMARFADVRTGRECRPTNERLVDAARCSLSTVQRARRVLKALGLVVEVTAGRSVMTLAQRLQAWEKGSRARRIAAEFALCSRPERLQVVDNRRADLQVVDDDTPPVGQVVRRSALEIRGSLRSKTESRKAAPRPAPTKKSRRRPAEPVDLGPRRLAEDVRKRLPWLSGVSAGRLTPLLTRFARADWTVDDVALAVRDVLAVNAWKVPSEFRTSPAAYLARLLRDVDEADRPSVLEQAYAAAMAAAAAEKRAAERRWTAALRTSCVHGVPAGDVPDPLRGVEACPQCRQRRAGV